MGQEMKGYSLAELLDDPVVGLVMKSDGVDRECLERLLARVDRERSGPNAGQVKD